MGAMAEIQKKGDNILASIQSQKKILEQLQDETEKVQQQKEAIILESDNLEQRKLHLETEVKGLSNKKVQLTESLKDEKLEMTRLYKHKHA